MRPLLGITDFTNFEQVQAMSGLFRQHLPKGSDIQLHVGVMMSYKTLRNIPSSWQNVFPPKKEIANIFSSDYTYNCLHFADYDGHPELWKSLHRAIDYGGMGIHALQLDMIWPKPAEIARAVHASRKQVEVILQVGRVAFEEIAESVDVLRWRLEEYRGVIQRVLLDKSGGHGVPMDAVKLLPFMRAIKKSFPEFGLIVAGGLGPNSLNLIEPLLEEFPDVSTDAQGKLRPSGDAHDPVDWGMAGEYVVRRLEMLK